MCWMEKFRQVSEDLWRGSERLRKVGVNYGHGLQEEEEEDRRCVSERLNLKHKPGNFLRFRRKKSRL